MKTFMGLITQVMACFILSVSVVQADVIYVGWRDGINNGVKAYDLNTGKPIAGFTTIPGGGSLQGIAVSPKDCFLYITNTSGTIKRYNPLTGAEDPSYSVSTGTTTRGLAFDNDGYLYAALGNKNIAQISPDGKTINKTWGGASSLGYANDIEVFNGKLYGGTVNGVSYWNLPTGGAAGTLVDTTGGQLYCNGLTFGLDGTLYTGSSNDAVVEPVTRSVRQWDATYKIENSTVLLALVYEENYVHDVDYWKGNLYAFCQNMVRRYNLSTRTWDEFIIGEPDFIGSVGYMAFSSVPEPNMLVLLGMSLASLLAYAWKKCK